ncbi:MAG: MFS transporter [Betaproteobacteria bacterium]|nr:MFS transporter [Betaproteobacteria bacterium]
MDSARRNVALLSGCQGLLLINNSVLITVNAIAGYTFATDKTLATLPVTAYFLGAALTTVPASFLMKHAGRRAGFMAGAACAMLGAALCAWAVYVESFWLLCTGTLALGAYFAAGQHYRFAAADAAPAEFKHKAISLVLAGGVIGGFIGPETSKLTNEAFSGHVFLGPYLSLIVFAAFSMLILLWLDIPRLPAAVRAEAGRPLSAIARQPVFIVAVLSGVVGYGVMNLLMTTTPIAMAGHDHHFSDAAFVIQWHVVAMFAPSFVTGALIQRFGLMPVMLTGVALNLACVAVALGGAGVMNFWLSMVLLGVGWNFMFVGATSLLTETHTPAERAKVQGVNDAAIFSTLVVSSLSAGALFSLEGWQAMNIYAVPFLILGGAGILWLAASRRRSSRPAT